MISKPSIFSSPRRAAIDLCAAANCLGPDRAVSMADSQRSRCRSSCRGRSTCVGPLPLELQLQGGDLSLRCNPLRGPGSADSAPRAEPPAGPLPRLRTRAGGLTSGIGAYSASAALARATGAAGRGPAGCPAEAFSFARRKNGGTGVRARICQPRRQHGGLADDLGQHRRWYAATARHRPRHARSTAPELGRYELTFFIQRSPLPLSYSTALASAARDPAATQLLRGRAHRPCAGAP